jgi:hypothetical protein
MQALALLREMPSRRLEPDVVSYSASISGCEWGMQWGSGIRKSASISSCEKGSQWVLALALLREMPVRRVQPGVVSYSAALCACEKSSLWAQALLLLREMLRKTVEMRIDIHGLALITNLVHQVDVWDDVVDYSIHHFIHDQVLCGLS